jgi:zinc transporter 1/2/3
MAGSNSTQNGTVHNHNSSAVTANALIFDQCIIASQAAGEVEEEFNMPLKVSGIFIVLFISTLACMVPMFATRFTWIRLPKTFMFGARHFGTGVLIATAFCHLLPTAFLSLHDPCLPSFWISEYTAMPGAIAMGAVFLITCIEMMFSRGGAGSHSHAVPIELTARENPYLHGSASSRASTMSTDTLGKHGKTNAVDYSQDVEGSTMAASALAATKKAVLQCTLLEMGILFHSVFIGMSLSVIPNEEFVVLVAAIAFHRKFVDFQTSMELISLT